MVIKIGTTVGNWLVTTDKFLKGKTYFHTCQCTCGVISDVRNWHLSHSYTKGCPKCSNVKTRFRYEGVGDLSKSYLNSFKAAKRHGRAKPFSEDMTLEYLWSLFQAQKSRCAISGVKIVLNPKWSAQNNGKKKFEEDDIQTASIDRIDSTKGYEVGNVQWVHKIINFMKGTLTDEKFIHMCGVVTRHQERKSKDGSTGA